MLLGGALAWLASSRLAQGDQAPTGYTLDDIYQFIATNGGTSPVEGNHPLNSRSPRGQGGMPTLEDVMAALREKLPSPGPHGCALPATGQTKCYDTDGNEIDCASADWPGQDGSYQLGCPTAGRFTDNGDGTVTDNCTGLMWQKETADVDESGTVNAGDRPNWQDALKYCENLDFAGHSDWRLPNVRELHSIVDYGRHDPAIDPVFAAESDWYWSSSSDNFFRIFAWYVNFESGRDNSYVGKDGNQYVRAVRNGP